MEPPPEGVPPILDSSGQILDSTQAILDISGYGLEKIKTLLACADPFLMSTCVVGSRPPFREAGGW